jgi:hypothetical protein
MNTTGQAPDQLLRLEALLVGNDDVVAETHLAQLRPKLLNDAPDSVRRGDASVPCWELNLLLKENGIEPEREVT